MLVMLSGGLDSTAALYKILVETDHPVIAHFIDYRTNTRRHEAEARAVAGIVPWLRNNVRDFTLQTTTQDYTAVGRELVDLHMYAFTAAQVIRFSTVPILAVVSGLIKTDREARGGTGNDRLSPQSSWENRRAVANAVFAACLSDIPNPPSWHFPCYDLTKADELRLLPPALAALTWSCRRPVIVGSTIAVCQTCHSCRDLEEARAELRQDR
jgi:7-cyano-7-deazaguanine synthase in queuosine biosynthesis